MFLFGILYIAIFNFLQLDAFALENWQQLKGDHFIIYYSQGFKDFSNQVLAKAEKDYDNIAHYLGYARYSNFWTWDNRVKIYIYPDKETFLIQGSQPEWSAGVANYERKEIISFAWSQNFLDFLLPHEIAHLMFRDFVGFKGEVPLWLDEGVAQWAEVNRRKDIMNVIAEAVDKGVTLSLTNMMAIDINKIRASELTALHLLRSDNTSFLKGEDLINLYYLQAASIVGFLIDRFGSDKFTEFCRGLRDGKMLEEALKSAYSGYINNLDDLQKEWLNYIRKD